MKYYGILDDFGSVIRWLTYKPSENYRYVVKIVKKPPPVDWNNYEESPF